MTHPLGVSGVGTNDEPTGPERPGRWAANPVGGTARRDEVGHPPAGAGGATGTAGVAAGATGATGGSKDGVRELAARACQAARATAPNVRRSRSNHSRLLDLPRAESARAVARDAGVVPAVVVSR